MGPWKTLPAEKPVHLEVVWVRLNEWYGKPFLAQWKNAPPTFTFVNGGATMAYPWYTINRWRSQ